MTRRSRGSRYKTVTTISTDFWGNKIIEKRRVPDPEVLEVVGGIIVFILLVNWLFFC